MKVLLYHKGLGDEIAFAPIAVKYAQSDSIILPCFQHNLSSVMDIFKNHVNIHVIPKPNERDIFKLVDSLSDKHEVIRFGFHSKDSPPLTGESFIDWIYRQASMTNEERWRICPIAQASAEYEGKKKYKIFLHEDRSRAFVIDRLKHGPTGFIFEPHWSHSSILQYVPYIKSAKEVHVIDSSFLHLAEALPITGKLFFHKYARDGGELSNYKFRKQCTVLE